MIGVWVSVMFFYVGVCIINKIIFFRMIIYWIYLFLFCLVNWNSFVDKVFIVDFIGFVGFVGELINDNWNI